MYGLSLRLESLFAAQSKAPDKPSHDADLSFQWVDLDQLLDQNSEAALASYLLAGVQASSNATSMTLTTDAAAVTGMNLQNTFLSYPSDIAVVCAPMVASALLVRAGVAGFGREGNGFDNIHRKN
jgi:hypothetical protein